MNEKEAKKVGKGQLAGRQWNTNGQPNKPLDKRWNGAGKVVRNVEKGGKNGE